LIKNDEEVTYQFVFDLFADNQQVMKRPQIKDFCEIFLLPQQEFGDKPVKFGQFYNIAYDNDLAFDEFDVCLPSITAMLGLVPQTDMEEKQAILAMVNDNPNIESYILDNITNEIEQFYVCEKAFWD
jgi:hypothetical protein